MATALDWAEVTLSDQYLSLDVPEGWEAIVGEFSTTFCGEFDGDYRPTVTVETGTPEGPGQGWFDEFAEQVVDHLAGSTPGFEALDTQRYAVAPLDADLFRVTAHWPAYGQDVPATTQLQAWIWIDSGRIVQFSAATDTRFEQRDLPIFERILRSIYLEPVPAE